MARKARARRAARGLAHTDTAALRREIERRAAGLLTRHETLASELAEVQAELTALGVDAGSTGRVGRGRPPGRRRARNKVTLIQALRAALKGKTMSAGQAADAVSAAGYKSKSESIVPQVRIALMKRKHFKRVERGRYTAK